MSEPLIGEIIMFGGNFAPRGWSYCDGQLLSIAANNALFAILGTTYGGDGRTTFGLPDLRGRVPVHSGGNSAGPGLPAYALGSKGGAETVTLNSSHLAPHTHTGQGVTSDDASVASPSGAILAVNGEDVYNTSPNNGTTYGDGTALTGNSTAVNIIMPSAVVHYIIALIGIFPSRN